MLTKEKQNAEIPDPQTETTPLRATGEDTPYPQGFTLPRKNSTTYVSPSTTYPFKYGLPQIVKTPGLLIREPMVGINPIDPLAVPDLDELAGKGKSLQDKALEKYEL